MKASLRTKPKPTQMWAVYNWGIIWHVYRLRRDALAFARGEATHYAVDTKPARWQDIFEIHKVMVSKT